MPLYAVPEVIPNPVSLPVIPVPILLFSTVLSLEPKIRLEPAIIFFSIVVVAASADSRIPVVPVEVLNIVPCSFVPILFPVIEPCMAKTSIPATPLN